MDHSGCKWQINDFYRPIAERLVERYEDLKHIPVKAILFVDNTLDKGKKANKRIKAKVYKVPTKYQEIIQQLTDKLPPAFIMEFYKENIGEMSREQIIMLIYHELKHIGRDGSILLHDIEDWPELVGTFGADWATTHSTLPDLIEDDIDWSLLKSRQITMFIEPKLRAVR